MERIDFGEEGDPKGFCWVELERGGADWQFIPVNARPFVTLDADLRESETPTDDLAMLIRRHDLREAVVRLRLQLTPESEARLNENLIRDQLKHAGVYQVAGIRKHIEQAVRARLGEVPEGLTQLELLERYFISKGVTSEDRATLIEHGRDLMEHGAGAWE
jgi:exonuclease SbcD